MRDIKKANEYIRKAWLIIVSIGALYLLAHLVYPELYIPFIDDTIGVFTKDNNIFDRPQEAGKIQLDKLKEMKKTPQQKFWK